ncbi:hypothetical protein [Jannaschia sp. R86511]|uniref:hypothetical protein n=1 Tax=Jannaschia sp. R86511 TaxID=3093853 RepID=UPI0036D43BF4
MTGADLFALAASLPWLSDQPGHQPSVDRLFDLVVGAVLHPPAGSAGGAVGQLSG